MIIDLQQRYDSSDDFFNLSGSVTMKISADAAVAICERAAQRGLVIARIEGGIWRAPGFEARLDCIWDGVEPPCRSENGRSEQSCSGRIRGAEKAVHDVYVLTAPRMSGW
ncbi:colicin immunity protein [Pseudomonas sp. HR96]|uniref:colicin immunity protein n=1 Tax=Pseudomonas sp. HR96 TaxID=1027966 RepID=UPI002A74C7C6|nr:colicin immunity protein [Pseudomonas sp. HR96]WPO98274.1 colicin immunity protein [Pseudomonas sp. HR96]